MSQCVCVCVKGALWKHCTNYTGLSSHRLGAHPKLSLLSCLVAQWVEHRPSKLQITPIQGGLAEYLCTVCMNIYH